MGESVGNKGMGESIGKGIGRGVGGIGKGVSAVAWVKALAVVWAKE